MASSQPIYCMTCGKLYQTNFNLFRGQVCSWRCWDELKWREALSILGEKYYPMPEEAQHNKANYEKDYSPFARPAEGFHRISETDAEYLKGDPQPLAITIPVSIDPHENIP